MKKQATAPCPPETPTVVPDLAAMTVINPARIAVVCPTVERADLVRAMIGSLYKTAKAAAKGTAAASLCLNQINVVLVCSGPDDGTALWARNRGHHVIESAEVLPFAKAVNLGAKAASEIWPHDWLLIVNNDIVFTPGYWEGLAELISWGSDVAGAKLLYPEGHQRTGQIQHCGKMFTLDGYPFHVLRFQPANHERAVQPRPYPSVTFALVAIKRRIWDDLGGLDEGYRNGYEDDDWCLRARELGASIDVHPGMLAYHHESQTSGHDTANKQEQWQRFQKAWIETGRIQWVLGVWQGWRSA